MKKVVLFLLFLFLVVFHNDSVMAENEFIPFVVKPNLPFNQQGEIKGYFKLKSEKNETHSLSFDLTNITKEEITVQIKPTNALTSLDGEIQYIASSGDEYSNLTNKDFEMIKNIQIQSEITLQPEETQKVSFLVQSPEKEVGVYLGGLLFYVENFKTEKINDAEEGIVFNVEHAFSYAMAIELNMPKPDKEKISFLGSGMKYIPSGIQTFIEIENEAAKIEKNISFEYRVYTDEKELIFSENINSFSMAPKSFIKVPFSWGSKTISEGEYIVEIEGKIGDKNFFETNKLHVTNHFLNRYQEETGNEVVHEYIFPWWVWLICVMTLLSLIIFMLMFNGQNASNDGDSNE